MHLCLLEYQEDAGFFLKHILPRIRREPYKVICLSPDPVLSLEKAGVSFQYPEDILPAENLSSLATQSWSYAEKVCRRLDEEIRERLPESKPFPYFGSLCSSTKIILDSCRSKIVQLKALLEAFRPAEVHFFATTPLPFDSRMLWDDLESIYTHLLPFVVESLAPKPRLHLYPQRIRRTARWWRRRQHLFWHPKLSSVRNAIRAFASEDVARVKRRQQPAKVYCRMQGTEAFLTWIVHQMDQRGWLIFRWSPISYCVMARVGSPVERLRRLSKSWCIWRRLHARMNRLWKELRWDPGLRDFFVDEGVNWFHVIEQRLRHLVTVLMPQEVLILREVEMLVPHIDGLIGSYFHGFAHAIALFARGLGKHVLTAQHGPDGFIAGGNGWPDMGHSLFYYSDTQMATHSFRWGPGVVMAMQEHGETERCLPIVTGAGHLRPGERKRSRTGRRRILYVVESFNRNVYDFGIGSSTVNTRYVVARRIIDALCQAKGSADLIVKTHPSPICSSNAIVDYIRERGYGANIADTGLLTDLLPKVDVVVLDDLSSPLAEAIPIGLPVFAFTGSFRIRVADKALLRTRVHFEEDLDAFCRLLSDMVRQPGLPDDLRNDDFERLHILPSGINLRELFSKMEQTC